MTTTTDGTSTGLLNLEKELICFICTEVLYQPLTLIDCLHTFCGSCLKEWFSHQYRKATHSHASTSSANPYTCPTCRASVQDAQHNAMINTLLEMFVAANPTKCRSEEEKREMNAIYKPGDDILPKIGTSERRRRARVPEELADDRRRRRDPEAERNRITLEQARERSLRENLRPESNRLAPNSRTARSRSSEQDERRERRRETERRPRSERSEERREHASSDVSPRPRERRETSSVSILPTSPRHPDAVEARSRARTVAHQASLRSIVSASESETGTGDSITEAQLMQEILDEGLLDGINIDMLTEAEQDDLSEIIAERYRQLHPRRAQRISQESTTATVNSGSADPRQEMLAGIASLQIEEADRDTRHSPRVHQRRADRSPRSDVGPSVDSRPPRSSSNHSQDQNLSPPLNTAHRRRASDQGGRRETIPRHHNTHPGASPSPATRSASDLTNRSSSDNTTSSRPAQFAPAHRAQTEPRQPVRASEVWRQRGTERNPGQIATPPQVDSPAVQSPTIEQATLADPNALSSVPQVSDVTHHIESDFLGENTPIVVNSSSTTLFEEPSISCFRCSRQNIQYELYKHCDPCDVDLCLRCYRIGRGCNHWFGFGRAALVKFESSHPNTTSSQVIELPHLLVSRQYHMPPSESIVHPNSTETPQSTHQMMTRSHPTSRLQEGKFCDRCHSFANSCFWECDYCNEGEWGFCNDCVNTHHCCTHPLLPIAHKLSTPFTRDQEQAPITQQTTLTSVPSHNMARSSPAHSQPSSAASAADFVGLHDDYVQLTIFTHCDICSQSISPVEARYHCPIHPSPTQTTGDYDICTNCYHNLVKTGRLKREDGSSGWRLCPDGHRMIVSAFEPDHENCQRRVVIHDLVGGTKMTEEDIATWRRAMTQEPTTSTNPGPPNSPPQTNQGQWTWREDSAGNIRASRKRTSTLSSSGNSKFPPNGGLGKKSYALWSYYPEEGDDGKGELMFPKHAQINEVEEINEDWWFGVYAGDTGVFPRVYVREITPRLI